MLGLGWGQQGLVSVSPCQHELGGGVGPLFAPLCLVELDQLVRDSRGQSTPWGGRYVTVQGDGGHIQSRKHCLQHNTAELVWGGARTPPPTKEGVLIAAHGMEAASRPGSIACDTAQQRGLGEGAVGGGKELGG